MAHSDFAVCPNPDCEQPVFIDESNFEDGVLRVGFHCPGCGYDGTFRHENPKVE